MVRRYGFTTLYIGVELGGLYDRLDVEYKGKRPHMASPVGYRQPQEELFTETVQCMAAQGGIKDDPWILI